MTVIYKKGGKLKRRGLMIRDTFQKNLEKQKDYRGLSAKAQPKENDKDKK
jgi:hypothetical protein